MKDNLFKRIWNKNFVKGTDKLDKFADDVGGLKGHFSWKKLDKNNNVLKESGVHNDITNLSKSTVIRLLAQGMPKYRSQTIDPAKYKITRMRFGNASYKVGNYNYGGSSVDNNISKKLFYYDSTEHVFRPNQNNGIGDNALNFKSAGGKSDGTTIASSITSLVKKEFYTADAFKNNSANYDNYLYPADKFGIINLGSVVIPIDKSLSYFSYLNSYSEEAKLYPPSHDTLKITLTFFNLANNNAQTSVIFTSSELDRKIYSRNLLGNEFLGSVSNNHITDNKLTFTYDNSLELWKINFGLTSTYLNQNFTNNTATVLGRITIEYNIGKYNIINSIIPKTGINSGSIQNRFTSDDYYTLVNNVYDSSPTDFIDDYSVNFSSIMNIDQGNGQSGSSLPVIYTEAFLFNEMDDLFSSIIYTDFPIENNNQYKGDTSSSSLSRAFIKTNNDAYLFQWTIKALI
jgi:hypothetical protein